MFLLLVGPAGRHHRPESVLRGARAASSGSSSVAPIAIVAIGQYFVIVGGEFDLSMGSVVTAQVVIAGNLIGQDDSQALPVLV